MKKMLTIVIAFALVVTALASCSKQNGGNVAKSPEELTQLYTDAITNNGGEMVEHNPVISQVSENNISAMVLETLGLNTKDMKAFSISASMMNVQAYGIAAVMPAEGKTDSVKEGLQSYIDRQKKSFEQYLVDQYEIAGNAKLETLEDGTVLMVMCENQNAIFDSISSEILAG